MAKSNVNETVYVSFHYLTRTKKSEGKEVPSVFTKTEFDVLVGKIQSQPTPNLSNFEEYEAVRYGRTVPFFDLDRVDDRTFRGTFQTAYSGHAFENSEKGKISAKSINQRLFHFLLYLSESGRIYVGTQYLGNYGDWGGLQRILRKMLGLGRLVDAHIVRAESYDVSKLEPIEVRVRLYDRSAKITGKNVFASSGLVVFKPSDEHSRDIREGLLPLKKLKAREARKAIAQQMTDGGLYSINADEIENCTIVARHRKSKGTHTIYLIGEEGLNATKFAIDVQKNEDGLPEHKATQSQMLNRLEADVISILEDI